MIQIFRPILDHKLRTIHFIKSDNKFSWYPQDVALEGLFRRLNKCFYRQYLKKGKLKTRFGYKQDESISLLDAKFDTEYSETCHENVWEFFKFIDYNHKNLKVGK